MILFFLPLVLSSFASPVSPGGPTAICPALIPVSDFYQTLRDAERAFQDMDIEGLNARVASLQATLPCIDDLLEPSEAVAWHRVQALSAWARNDRPLARLEFQSILYTQPSAMLSVRYAPVGGPMSQVFEEARRLPAPAEEAIFLTHRTILVDGISSTFRPLGIPIILQVQNADGTLEFTGALPADAALPDLEHREVSPDPARALVVPPTEATSPRHPVLLAASAGATALASGGLYLLAWNLRVAYDDEKSGLQESELEDLRAKTNRMAVASTGLGAIALGLGGIVVWQW